MRDRGSLRKERSEEQGTGWQAAQTDAPERWAPERMPLSVHDWGTPWPPTSLAYPCLLPLGWALVLAPRCGFCLEVITATSLGPVVEARPSGWG